MQNTLLMLIENIQGYNYLPIKGYCMSVCTEVSCPFFLSYCMHVTIILTLPSSIITVEALILQHHRCMAVNQLSLAPCAVDTHWPNLGIWRGKVILCRSSHSIAELQLPADNITIFNIPRLITNSLPVPFHEYLNTALFGAVTMLKTHIAPNEDCIHGRKEETSWAKVGSCAWWPPHACTIIINAEKPIHAHNYHYT